MELIIDFSVRKTLECSADIRQIEINPQGARQGSIAFSFPVADVHSYWVSTLALPSECIPWRINFDSAVQGGMPFITFFNTAGINQLAAGLIDLFCDLEISAKMNQETCSYDVVFTLNSETSLPHFRFFLDLRKQNWQKCVSAWRESQTLPEHRFPEAAWEPVYCTWYAIHGAVTEDWCDRAAAAASEYGFGTFILDDGWCYPDRKRVTPQTILSWYEKVGDWVFDQRKFPDAASHVKRVQALGMKYLVWIAPYLVGDHSEMYRQLKKLPDGLFGEYHEGYYSLETRNQEACQQMLDRLEKLIPQYGLDGLKVDFLDQIPPDVETPRAASCERFTAELSRRIRKAKPDALIEYRQSYSTPQMLAYGTQFRAGDCPFDFLLNFRRIAQIRIALGDGVPVHADPAYWPATERAVNVARHFIAMMAGVPMLSINLESLTDEMKKIIRFWIGFYRQNSVWLKDASWEFDYSGGMLGCALGSDGKHSLAIVADVKRIPRLSSPGWILNLSPEEFSLQNAEVFDLMGNPIAGNNVPLGGGAFLA